MKIQAGNIFSSVGLQDQWRVTHIFNHPSILLLY